MPQVLIRDIDNETLKKLKKRAEENHRSLQRELHVILSEAAALAGTGTAKRASRSMRTARKGNRPAGSVWTWLKRPSAGNLSKEEIDSYIRAERDSWGEV